MEQEARLVLVVTEQGWIRERLTGILAESGYQTVCVDSTEQGIEAASKTRFELMVVEYSEQSANLSEFLKTVRWRQSASRDAAVVFLATPDELDGAEQYLDHSVCRILNPAATPERIGRALRESVSHEPRFGVRALIRIAPQDGDSRTKIMAQTENVSTSGMLIRYDKYLPVGSRVTFDLELPNQTAPISGVATIVRLTHSASEAIDGFGARFVSLRGDSEGRLLAFMQDHSRRLRPPEGAKNEESETPETEE